MTATVTSLILAVPASQADGVTLRAAVGKSAVSGAAPLQMREPERAARKQCPRVLAAVRFYSRRIDEHRARMGAAAERISVPRTGCPRYLAHVLQRKARAWRLRADRWLEHHYAWELWLPANWRRLGACETGYGREPGNWRHDSGTHVSAFGITRHNYAVNAARIGRLSWDETRRRLGRYPTPREQFENALSHLATYGDGWTCPGP